METNRFIEACEEELTCKHCGITIKGSFSRYGGGITSKDALKRHEEQCSKNPESSEGKLIKDIKRCQTESKIFNCLNCQHYHKRCSGAEK